ncbi:MAG: 6-chlorohydroxyquinol-1,2-dioxygenase [Paracoccaceae bacterium]|nr:MAG: 6-chlorohydroxyquinol-1,2-dioxygenase [Paracoccaceae bacterium]
MARMMDGAPQDRSAEHPRDALARRLAEAGAQPGVVAMVTVIDHLHRLVADLRPTPDDLRRTLEFLTEVGQQSDARRQEWVLLADVLGVSTAVEDIANPRPEGATPNTVAGPFYRPDAPEQPIGADICRDARGEPLAVAGRVAGLEGQAVAGAVVEVWHANGEGLYENQEPDRQPDMNLRGRFTTDAAGRFGFRSIKPAGYRLPCDGPVGRLAQALGLCLERPAHLHFRVTAPGFQTLTTHVFDRDDPAIGRDALFGVKPALCVQFRPHGTAAARHWTVETTLVLAPLRGTPTA